LSPDCPACPYCADRCIGKGIEHPVWELPRVKGPQLAAFFDAGILDLRDIPADFPLESLTDQQHRVKECVVTEQSYVSSGLKAALDAVRWPVYYLDFETVSTGVPLYADVAPWTQHLTQYSIHRCEVPGVVDGHCAEFKGVGSLCAPVNANHCGMMPLHYCSLKA